VAALAVLVALDWPEIPRALVTVFLHTKTFSWRIWTWAARLEAHSRSWWLTSGRRPD